MLSKYKPFSLSFISPNNQKWLRRIILNSCVRDIFLYSFFQFHFLSFSIVIRNGEAVLATFCYYDHGPKVSEAVQKIAIDQK